MNLPVRVDSERVIFALAAAAEAKDAYTESHTQRVANTAVHLGTRLGLQESDLVALYRGGETLMRGAGQQWDRELVSLLLSELPAIRFEVAS
jgi:hypothetical protein